MQCSDCKKFLLPPSDKLPALGFGQCAHRRSEPWAYVSAHFERQCDLADPLVRKGADALLELDFGDHEDHGLGPGR